MHICTKLLKEISGLLFIFVASHPVQHQAVVWFQHLDGNCIDYYPPLSVFQVGKLHILVAEHFNWARFVLIFKRYGNSYHHPHQQDGMEHKFWVYKLKIGINKMTRNDTCELEISKPISVYAKGG